MIQTFVDRYTAIRDELRAEFEEQCPASYRALVKQVIEKITADEYEYYAPDPERIHEIDDGDYQGTLLYLIAEKGYQPNTYYAVKISYGSCSACDTLKSIQLDYNPWWSDKEGPQDEAIEERKQAVDDLMTLSLHIVQRIKEV